jgi:hypothetical protein
MLDRAALCLIQFGKVDRREAFRSRAVHWVHPTSRFSGPTLAQVLSPGKDCEFAEYTGHTARYGTSTIRPLPVTTSGMSLFPYGVPKRTFVAGAIVEVDETLVT